MSNYGIWCSAPDFNLTPYWLKNSDGDIVRSSKKEAIKLANVLNNCMRTEVGKNFHYKAIQI